MSESQVGRPSVDPEVAEAVERGKSAVQKAVQAPDQISDQEEKDALDFLLGGLPRLEYTVPVQIETPDGPRELIWRIRQVGADEQMLIEQKHRDADNPFSRVDAVGFAQELVLAGTVAIGTPGRMIAPDDEEWVGGHPLGAAGAMKTRFKHQGGIFFGLRDRIQEVSGTSSNVGSARPAGVDKVAAAAVGGS